MTVKQSRITLLTLPDELLYRICDFLDTKTIVFSFRNVCTQFYAIANTYNQYKVCFRSMSMMNICRIIHPKNIVTLDFWDNNQANDWIELFLSMFNINQFTRLRLLSIHKIDKNNLNIILNHILMNCKLSSFAVDYDVSCDNHTLELLCSIIGQPTLRNLLLHFNLSDKNKLLVWPNRCNIEKLSVSICTIKQICSILNKSPYLHQLTMNDCYINEIDEIILSNSYQQLTSLTFNDIRMTMDKLEHLLSLVPYLLHLDITSSGKPFEFVRRLSQWEEFIQLKLPRLTHFEFCIFCFSTNWDHFESVILAFRTPFWLNEKHWYVTCQFRDDWTSSFTIFTSTNPSMNSNHSFDKITCPNSNTIEYYKNSIKTIE